MATYNDIQLLSSDVTCILGYIAGKVEEKIGQDVLINSDCNGMVYLEFGSSFLVFYPPSGYVDEDGKINQISFLKAGWLCFQNFFIDNNGDVKDLLSTSAIVRGLHMENYKSVTENIVGLF
jgi:hypothetical protein